VKILTIHNKYKIRGGEDECREAEGRLMAAHGHESREIIFENDDINSANAVTVGLQAAWSRSSYQRTLSEIRAWRPDVVTVHNFFPVASPSVYYAARECDVPVVQTLHNYRLLCPRAMFYRREKICEECLGKRIPWPGVLHGCYRGSRPATLAVASMLTVHNFLDTWREQVDIYIALTNFAKQKFIEGGLPPEKLTVKPNFVMCHLGPGGGNGGYVLFVGRLTEDKGIRTLIDAWKSAEAHGRLVVVGDGPLSSFVEDEASATGSIHYLGRRPQDEVYALLGDARALVFPSRWYEGMPRVIIEAFCRGTPVIASGIGSMTEIIADLRTGWLVPPGDIPALAHVIRTVCNPANDMTKIRADARHEFEALYTAERNYHLLLEIYERAIGDKKVVQDVRLKPAQAS
jgi:glycosyltransferase involved in cell wall biosynthesis